MDNNLPRVPGEDEIGAQCRAVARGRITMRPETLAGVRAHTLKKGDVLEVARFAALQAAKSSSSLLPLSTSALLSTTTVEFILGEDYIDIEVTVQGIDSALELPAFSAATTSALTIYDMCKSADRTMVIGPVQLLERTARFETL